jgi:hypothetical protein
MIDEAVGTAARENREQKIYMGHTDIAQIHTLCQASRTVSNGAADSYSVFDCLYLFCVFVHLTTWEF